MTFFRGSIGGLGYFWRIRRIGLFGGRSFLFLMRPLSVSGTMVTTCLVIAVVAVTWVDVGCSRRNEDSKKLMVFAASSLGDALGLVEKSYEEISGQGLLVNYGPSQILAQQIFRGAPADVFISAGESPVEFLSSHHLLEFDEIELLTNKLVVVVRQPDRFYLESIHQISDPNVRRIALADPNFAPAGQYAKESLSALGLWEDVHKKLVFGLDVRAALSYVETGNADVGIVYATDAASSKVVTVADIVPSDSYSQIVYPVVVLKSSRKKEAVTEFLEFLHGGIADEIFSKMGFNSAP